MTPSSPVAAVLRLLAFQSIWLVGCVGDSALEQTSEPDDQPREEPRVVEQHARTFNISVDGTERGKLTMLLTTQDDGTETMSAKSELNFNFIVYKYRYSSSGTETWKSGRLIHLINEADYNGDKYVVQATAQQQELAFQVNGEPQNTAADVWVTSYWSEPESRRVGQQISLFTAGKGEMLTGTLQRVGTEQLSVVENSVNTTHYQIRGDVEVDLWYDDEHRLVRQAARESGHRVVLELSQITR